MGLQSEALGARGQGEALEAWEKETTEETLAHVPASCWLRRALLSRQPLSCLSLSPLALPALASTQSVALLGAHSTLQQGPISLSQVKNQVLSQVLVTRVF